MAPPSPGSWLLHLLAILRANVIITRLLAKMPISVLATGSSASNSSQSIRHRNRNSRRWHLPRLLLLVGLLAAVSFENWIYLAVNDTLKSFVPEEALLGTHVVEVQTQRMKDLAQTKQQRQRQLLNYPEAAPDGSAVNSTDRSVSNATAHPEQLHFDNQTPYYLFGKYRYRFFPRNPDPRMENRKALYLLQEESPSWIGRDSRTFDLYQKSQQLNDKANEDARILSNLPSSFNMSPELFDATDTWVLPNPMLHATRNHDTIILERATARDEEAASSVLAATLLGRHNRHVQWMDLITGKQGAVRTGGSGKNHNDAEIDPAGWPLDDLNHVSAVLVDSLSNDNSQEIWMTCGFHNDRVNSEVSAQYARIVDVDTWRVRVGPKLPIAGGACVAHALSIIPGEPPMICNLGGTQGTHDRGKFLPQTACYDRVREQWWSPLGDLPYGLDHGSLAAIPAGVCHADDPARLIVLNFRTKPYGDAHTEMLAYDLPTQGWKLDKLEVAAAGNATATRSNTESSDWYVYYNGTASEDERENNKDVGRDASGTMVVNGGRHIVNFGGTYHYLQDDPEHPGKKKKRVRGRFSMIRAFDVCRREWSVVGDLGVHTFALQTAASQDLQVALTCGGETTSMRHSNGHWCFVNRFHNGMVLSNRYERK